MLKTLYIFILNSSRLKLSPSCRFKTVVRGGQYRRSARNLSVSALSNILFPSLHERIYEPGMHLLKSGAFIIDVTHLEGVEYIDLQTGALHLGATPERW